MSERHTLSFPVYVPAADATGKVFGAVSIPDSNGTNGAAVFTDTSKANEWGRGICYYGGFVDAKDLESLVDLLRSMDCTHLAINPPPNLKDVHPHCVHVDSIDEE
jgi:hypothetical protein